MARSVSNDGRMGRFRGVIDEDVVRGSSKASSMWYTSGDAVTEQTAVLQSSHVDPRTVTSAYRSWNLRFCAFLVARCRRVACSGGEEAMEMDELRDDAWLE